VNINEFKAWFEGFSEGVTGDAPTPEQWKKIKAKVEGIRTGTGYTGIRSASEIIDDATRRPRNWRSDENSRPLEARFLEGQREASLVGPAEC
jgi:hypothetical protein